jgi:carbonic anhydrase
VPPPLHSPRRAVLASLAGAGLVTVTSAWSPATAQAVPPVARPAQPPRGWPTLPPPARTALGHLLEGNARFRSGRAQHPHQGATWRAGLAAAQHPLASIFGCVDSRVPDTIVTDQGLGDLFTTRTAGHVLDDAALGSLEFGVEELDIELLVVLGHESCGAVTAAITALDGGQHAPGAIQHLVDALRPAVRATAAIRDPRQRVDAAVRWHTRATVRRLVTESKIISTAVRKGRLGVVGARYDLDSGELAPA